MRRFKTLNSALNDSAFFSKSASVERARLHRFDHLRLSVRETLWCDLE